MNSDGSSKPQLSLFTETLLCLQLKPRWCSQSCNDLHLLTPCFCLARYKALKQNIVLYGFFSYILVAMICDMPYFLHLGQCQKWLVWTRTSRQDVGLYKPSSAGSSSLPAKGRGWKGPSPSLLGERLHPRGCVQLLLGNFSSPCG